MGKMWTTNNCKGLGQLCVTNDHLKMVLKLIAGVFPSAVLLTIEKKPKQKTQKYSELAQYGTGIPADKLLW